MCAQCESECIEVFTVDSSEPVRVPRWPCPVKAPVTREEILSRLNQLDVAYPDRPLPAARQGEWDDLMRRYEKLSYVAPRYRQQAIKLSPRNVEATVAHLKAEQEMARHPAERVCLDCHLTVWPVDWVPESGRCDWCQQLHVLKAGNLIDQLNRALSLGEDASGGFAVPKQLASRTVTITELQPKVLSRPSFLALAAISAVVAVALVLAIAGAVIFG